MSRSRLSSGTQWASKDTYFYHSCWQARKTSFTAEAGCRRYLVKTSFFLPLCFSPCCSQKVFRKDNFHVEESAAAGPGHPIDDAPTKTRDTGQWWHLTDLRNNYTYRQPSAPQQAPCSSRSHRKVIDITKGRNMKLFPNTGRRNLHFGSTYPATRGKRDIPRSNGC